MKLAFLDIAEEVEPFVMRWLPQLSECRVLSPQDLQEEKPDVVFYGDGKSGSHRSFRDSTRVHVTYENLYPNFAECDYAVAYVRLNHPRYLRMPDWAIIHKPEKFIKAPDYAERVIAEKRDFCAFVASNGNPRRTRRRIEFFQKLDAQRRVNSGGRVFNNIGFRVTDHYGFAAKHRFYMAFENASYPGYTTEKIADGMTSGCVPIYWGDPTVGEDFNPRSFIDVRRFADDDTAIRHVLEAADRPELYRAYLEEPFFNGNRIPGLFDSQRILSFFRKLVDEPRPRRQRIALRPAIFKAHRRMQPYIDSLLPMCERKKNHAIGGSR